MHAVSVFLIEIKPHYEFCIQFRAIASIEWYYSSKVKSNYSFVLPV